MQNLIFYTHPMSRGRTVRWMLEECGAQYETVYLTYNGTMKSDDYLKINPMGKVPSFVHNGKIITETAAIVTYLAEIFPNKNLIPDNHAEFYRWMYYFAGPAEAACMDKMAGLKPTNEMQIQLGYGNFEDMIKTIEGWLRERTYIAENQFSAADIYATSFLDFLREKDTYDSQIFRTYCERHLNRPAALNANKLDDDAFKAMEE